MNKQNLSYGLLAIALTVIIVGGAAWLTDGFSRIEEARGTRNVLPSNTLVPTNASALASQHIAPGMTNAAPADPATVRKVLQELMRQKGLKAMAPPREYLQAAVATDDNAKIARAFNDMVYAGWPSDQVVAALRDFLDSSNQFVRYLAGKYLFVVGDQSGYDTLLALVQSNTPINGTGEDARIQAAEALAQFRQIGAAPAIAALYQQTKNGDLISALATLGSPQAAELTEARGYFSDASSLAFYGQAGATQFIPQIASTFNNTQNPAVKEAAAWALATMTGDAGATNYLIQTAQAGLNNPSQMGSGDEKNVISYIGSIQSPAAKQTLEAALNSSDPGVVQVAALNLVFNQGGADQVNQMVAAELTGTTTPLGLDMALNLASQLLADPKIQAAGQTFSQQDGSGAWQRATVTRADWSTYNWMSGIYISKKK